MSIRDTIYRKALSILSFDYDQLMKGATEENKPKEVLQCDFDIETSCIACSTATNWYWLIETTTLNLNLNNSNYMGLDFSFDKPTNFLKMYRGNNEYNFSYAIKGNNIYSNTKSLKIDYIVDVIKELDNEEWDYPPCFLDFIASTLAVSISPIIAPTGSFGQNATAKMQVALSACNALQKDGYRVKNDRPIEYLDTKAGRW